MTFALRVPRDRRGHFQPKWLPERKGHAPVLDAAFRRFLPRAQTQFCQKQARANASRRVRQRERELFSNARDEIFYALTDSAARAAFFTVKQQWGRLFPSAMQVIERDLDSLPAFFQFDPTHWLVLRTTNPIERPNKEFKRRTNLLRSPTQPQRPSFR